MSPPFWNPGNPYKLVLDYRAGRSVSELAKELGIDRATLFGWFRRQGIPLRKQADAARLAHRPPWDAPDPAAFIASYSNGESVKSLAYKHRVTRGMVTSFLSRSNIHLRNQSASEYSKWARADDSVVNRQLHKAWRARRTILGVGETERPSARPYSTARLFKMARTREANCSGHRGSDEFAFESSCKNRLALIPQAAVGPYNVDFAACERRVAIEIQRGNLHAKGFKVFTQRLEYLLDAGYAVLLIYAPTLRGAFDWPRVTCQAIAFTKIIRRSPSLRGQYGMIGRDGEPVTPRSFKDYEGTRVPGF